MQANIFPIKCSIKSGCCVGFSFYSCKNGGLYYLHSLPLVSAPPSSLSSSTLHAPCPLPLLLLHPPPPFSPLPSLPHLSRQRKTRPSRQLRVRPTHPLLLRASPTHLLESSGLLRKRSVTRALLLAACAPRPPSPSLPSSEPSTQCSTPPPVGQSKPMSSCPVVLLLPSSLSPPLPPPPPPAPSSRDRSEGAAVVA